MPATHVRTTARRPTYDGTETVSWADVATTFQAYRDGYYRHSDTARPDAVPTRVQDAPQDMRTWIANRSLLGEATAENPRDLTMFPVVNPGTDRLNEGALRAVLGGRGAAAAIPAATLTSARTMARRLLNQEFDAELEVNTMADDGQQATRRTAIQAIRDLVLGRPNPDEPVTHGSRLAARLTSLVETLTTDDRSRSAIVAELAEAADISPGTVNQILAGTIIRPPDSRLRGLARVLGTSFDNLQRLAEQDAAGMTANDGLTTHLTVDNIRMALYAALARGRNMMYGPDVIVDIELGADGQHTCIYRDGERLFRKVFTIEDGQVMLGDEAEEVQQDTRYMPVVAADTPAAAQPAAQAAHPEGASTMDRDATIAGLIAHAQTGWTEDHKALLESMLDVQLTALQAEAATRPAQPEDLHVLQDSEPPVSMTALQELLGGLETRLETRLSTFMAEAPRQAERERLVLHLQEHGFSEEDVKGMSLEVLHKVARTTAPVSYAGLGFPGAEPAGDDTAIPDAPDWS